MEEHMILRKTRYGAAAAAIAILALAAATSLAQETKSLTVVELFTSQGCSSCPPANANLIQLKDRPGVLALSFGVTYWDHLGWKDVFGRPEFTERQIAYESPFGHRGPFTPQIVVNGSQDTVGDRLSDIEALIGKAHPNGPALSLSGGQVLIGTGGTPNREADIWLVRYKPGVIQVPVARGENSGRTLPHANVVQSLTRLGSWKGGAVALLLPVAAPGFRTAVLVQAPNGGPILAAASD
jgi:hypothetical protein